MSLSIFDKDLTDTQKMLKESNRELEKQMKEQNTILEKMKLAKNKMSFIRTMCQKRTAKLEQESAKKLEQIVESYSLLLNDSIDGQINPNQPCSLADEEVIVLSDYDDYRIGIKSKVLKNPLPEKRGASLQDSRGFNSPHRKRLVELKDISVSSNSRKKSRKQKSIYSININKEDTKKSPRPSKFNKRNSCIPRAEEKKRNSQIIQNFGDQVMKSHYEPPKRSKFANKLTIEDDQPAPAPRDSIDIQNFRETGAQRPSTLVEMRDSMFKLDAGLVIDDCFNEVNIDVDDAVSDISDYECEIDVVNDKDASPSDNKAKVLRTTILQTDNKFFNSSSSHGLNIASAFIDKNETSNKYGKRAQFFEEFANDASPAFFFHDGYLVDEQPSYSETENHKLYLNISDSIQTDGSKNSLMIQKLKQKVGEKQGESIPEEDIKQLLNTSFSCCYSSSGNEATKYSIGGNYRKIQSIKLNPCILNGSLDAVNLLGLSLNQSESTIRATTFDSTVLFGLEFTKESLTYELKPGTEFYFNKIDGIRVEGVLPAGFTSEELLNFLPKTKKSYIDVMNRHLFKPGFYKYLLMVDPRFSGWGDKESALDSAVKECNQNPKLLARLVRFKNQYLTKIALKQSLPLLKLSLIRNYESFGLKKKVSELVVFWADPEQLNEADPKNPMKDQLRIESFTDKNVLQIGRSLQQRLPSVRSDLEKSNMLFAVDVDYDIEIGYSRETEKFFIRQSEEAKEQSGEYEKVESIHSVNPADLRGVFSPSTQLNYRLEEPKEGLWVPLPLRSEVVLPNLSLLAYDTTAARISVEEAHII